jgi:hypothetical protein
VPSREWWRAEARRCAEDGHPAAAVAAMACALVGEDQASDPAAFRSLYPDTWARLETYAEALGVPLPD